MTVCKVLQALCGPPSCQASFSCPSFLSMSGCHHLLQLQLISFQPSPSSSGLAATMRTVKHPADFLSPPQRSIWDVIQVRSLLDYLTPHSSNIFFAKPSLVYDNETAHPSIHGDCTHPSAAHHNLNVSSADLIEPYFGTQYAIYCTDSKLIQKWEKPNVPVGTFFLPDFETYTPHNLTLLPLPADHSKVPQLVHDDKQGEH